MPNCLKWHKERHDRCVETRDDGYEVCERQEKRCVSWLPSWLGWFCKVFGWICVAATWIENIVCVAWTVITTAICVAWEAVNTVISAVLTALEGVLGWVLSGLAFIVEAIFAIPYVGPLLRDIWNAWLNLFWTAVGAFDGVLGIIGIRPEKKIRICTVILADRTGAPIWPREHTRDILQAAAMILKREANIRLLPVRAFQFSSGFGDEETVTDDWIVEDGDKAATDLLTAPGKGVFDDLGKKSGAYQNILVRRCFFGSWRRILGYGSPVTLFVVKTIPVAGDGNCGATGRAFWFSGYVFARAQPCPATSYATPPPGVTAGVNRRVVAHEVGHLGHLFHLTASGDSNNLMFVPWSSTLPELQQSTLAWWQIAALRSSRYCSYF